MQFRLMMVLVGAATLSGCATLVNPGKSRSVEPAGGGSNVKVARLRLRNTGPVLAVYNGATPLDIRDEASHDLHVTLCRTFHEDGTEPPGLVTVNADCMSRIVFPYVELPKSGRHMLRLVRPDGEVTVTVKAGMHWQWIWLNGVCFAAAPLCWGVDAVSGNWSYFGTLDVANAMRTAGARTAAATRD